VLGIAQESSNDVWQPRRADKESSGDVIRLSNLGHLAVDALMEPNVFDNSIRVEDLNRDVGKLHRIALSVVEVMNRGDSIV